ncbi:(S)-benzoin forming benzil reductase [Sediminibacillus albus]|uniref:Benzil reductase ((S)-benzoin forming) n=1 Tax=Sediminibacillus albus TaxID=407036 RepID=A0A1G8XH38_9BACI|nr:(S)-benzoin forming benzil reductase [Sediminibacillus albus]SDJ89736.1 benzil reductase ((S)-benzoin forming) [Sediminibacillus albus]
MELAIVTGVSRGLGAAIAELMLEKGTAVMGLARQENKHLQKVAEDNSTTFESKKCDLNNLHQVEAIFTEIANKAFNGMYHKVYLINNAGVVNPVDTAGNYSVESLSNHVNVNLTAPMATSNLFLHQAAASRTELVVVNVTSGAAQRSVYGWSAYCSTKAALNRFTETVALEQEELGTRCKAILYDPGIMDTEMQGTIRSSSEEQFKDVENFKQYKETNSLRDTKVVAEALLNFLEEGEDLVNGKIYSIKDLY